MKGTTSKLQHLRRHNDTVIPRTPAVQSSYISGIAVSNELTRTANQRVDLRTIAMSPSECAEKIASTTSVSSYEFVRPLRALGR